jgi:hypothetical protein
MERTNRLAQHSAVEAKEPCQLPQEGQKAACKPEASMTGTCQAIRHRNRGRRSALTWQSAGRIQRRRYRLVGKGYSICVAFLKLFEKVYAPLTAGLLAPFRGDRALTEEKRCTLDRLYQQICDGLDALLQAVGLKIAA